MKDLMNKKFKKFTIDFTDQDILWLEEQNMKSAAASIRRYRNKLNGLEYIISKNQVKYVDGEKFVGVRRSLLGETIWVRSDVLELIPED